MGIIQKKKMEPITTVPSKDYSFCFPGRNSRYTPAFIASEGGFLVAIPSTVYNHQVIGMFLPCSSDTTGAKEQDIIT